MRRHQLFGAQEINSNPQEMYTFIPKHVYQLMCLISAASNLVPKVRAITKILGTS
jgi:hypothetical protein